MGKQNSLIRFYLEITQPSRSISRQKVCTRPKVVKDKESLEGKSVSFILAITELYFLKVSIHDCCCI